MSFQCTRCGEPVESSDDRTWICRSCGKAGPWSDFRTKPKKSAESKAAFLAAAHSLSPLGLDRGLHHRLNGGERDGDDRR